MLGARACWARCAQRLPPGVARVRPVRCFSLGGGVRYACVRWSCPPSAALRATVAPCAALCAARCHSAAHTGSPLLAVLRPARCWTCCARVQRTRTRAVSRRPAVSRRLAARRSLRVAWMWLRVAKVRGRGAAVSCTRPPPARLATRPPLAMFTY